MECTKQSSVSFLVQHKASYALLRHATPGACTNIRGAFTGVFYCHRPHRSVTIMSHQTIRRRSCNASASPTRPSFRLVHSPLFLLLPFSRSPQHSYHPSSSSIVPIIHQNARQETMSIQARRSPMYLCRFTHRERMSTLQGAVLWRDEYLPPKSYASFLVPHPPLPS
jgi:hypothetical protein